MLKIFVDANVYLHYRSIEEIDLPAILGAENVTVVIPRITLKELDKENSTHPSRKIRDRAHRALKKIEEWTSGKGEVRCGVLAEFYPKIPTLDYEGYGLSSVWNDDVLLAVTVGKASGKKVVLPDQVRF